MQLLEEEFEAKLNILLKERKKLLIVILTYFNFKGIKKLSGRNKPLTPLPLPIINCQKCLTPLPLPTTLKSGRNFWTNPKILIRFIRFDGVKGSNDGKN